MSISLANDQGSLPVAWQLYLPKAWAVDTERRLAAGMPETIEFATKTQIALAQLGTLLPDGAPRWPMQATASITHFVKPCEKAQTKR